MFGIGNQKGVTLPQVFTNELTRGDSTDNLTISGTKPQPVQSFNTHRNIMLPHISQKSQRPMPRKVYNVYSINKSQSCMLEAIEIYKRRSKGSHSPEQKETLDLLVQSVPCPTPIEQPVTAINEAKEEDPVKIDDVQIIEKKVEPTVTKQPTRLLPVTITLQKRLEKLAKHKSNMTKRRLKDTKPKDTNSTKSTEGNIKAVVLPSLKENHMKHHLHYTFKSKLLPSIPKQPDKTSLSYQLLELPRKLSKPEKKRTMFTRSDYDMFQHTKFVNPADKKLSIVEGPDSQLKAVWDYNKFLYLNAKI